MTITITPGGHRLDVIPSGRDVRDYIWRPPAGILNLPTSFDMEALGLCPPIDDQGVEGSCVGHAVAGDDEITQRVDGVTEFKPSRAFAYWAARMADSGVAVADTGASIRGGVAGLAQYGICNEILMSYTAGGYSIQPNGFQLMAAASNRITAYHACPQDLTTLKAAIASRKPVIFGFPVYQSFENVGPDGMVGPAGGSLFGYHANVLVGYDDTISRFKDRNSWGTGWGKSGYCWLSYNDILNPNFAFDLWIVDTVPGPPVPPPPPPPPPKPIYAKQINIIYSDGHTKGWNL